MRDQPEASPHTAMAERLRVLMVLPKFPPPVTGGMERQAHELAKSLKNDWDVDVRVLSGQFEREQPRYEVVDGVPVVRFPWPKSRLVRFITAPLHVAWAVFRCRRDIDVIHVHQNSPISLFVVALARVLGIPVLTKLPSIGVYGVPGLRSAPLGILRIRVLLLSSAIVAMTKESLRELRDVGFSPQRVLAVPNGITVDAIGRTEPKCDNEQVRVVFVGRFSAEKRLPDLLEAWKLVCSRVGDRAHLELWGDGSIKPTLQKMCTALGLDGFVTWRGHVSDVRANLRTADLFVLPSETEGNSNAVLEAMEAGLPVVATAVGGTPMQVGSEGRGLLVRPGDRTALAETLTGLILDRERRRSIGHCMRERATRHFDLRLVAGAYRCAYIQLRGGREIDLARCSTLPEC